MASINNPAKTKCNKVRFNTEEEANRDIGLVVILNISKGKANRNSGLHSYECPYCNKYHIGHNRGNKNSNK